MKIPAFETKRGLIDGTSYNLLCKDAGKFAVIQLGIDCFGVGDTREEAIKVANELFYEDYEDDIESEMDTLEYEGSINVYKIMLVEPSEII